MNSVIRSNSRGHLSAVLAVWAVLSAAVLMALARYQGEAAPTSEVASQWPAPAELELSTERLTLLLFAHPRCPCTRASLTELDRLMTRVRDSLAVTIVLYDDPQLGEDWADTDIRRRAEAIEQARVIEDPGAELALQFGALTSGHVLVYDARGALRFQGGITAFRGHEGDSDGSHAILQLCRDPDRLRTQHPVFGCPIVSPAQAAAEVDES